MSHDADVLNAAGRLGMARRWGNKEEERRAERDLAELRAFRLRRRAEEAERVAEKARRRAARP